MVPARGCSSWSSSELAREIAHGDQALREAALLLGQLRAVLALGGEGVELRAGEALERGDQVGGDALRHHRVLLGQVRVVAVEPAAARAHRHARHGLDAAADHQVLLAGHHAHRREVHGLRAGAAEAVERHAAARRRASRR